MSRNDDIKASARPWIELFAKGIAEARAEGVSPQQLTALLEQLEKDIAWVDPDVQAVIMGELRKSIGLK